MEQNCKYPYFFLSHWSTLQHHCPNYWPMLQLIHLVQHDFKPINGIPVIFFHKHNCILILEITHPLTLVNTLQQDYKLDVILMHHIGNIPLLLFNMRMRFYYITIFTNACFAHSFVQISNFKSLVLKILNKCIIHVVAYLLWLH
jgi:hypothetical protein